VDSEITQTFIMAIKSTFLVFWYGAKKYFTKFTLRIAILAVAIMFLGNYFKSHEPIIIILAIIFFFVSSLLVLNRG